MDMTVARTSELDATASLSQMEPRVQAAGREAMQDGFKQAIHQREEQQHCPMGGSHEARTQGTRRRV